MYICQKEDMYCILLGWLTLEQSSSLIQGFIFPASRWWGSGEQNLQINFRFLVRWKLQFKVAKSFLYRFMMKSKKYLVTVKLINPAEFLIYVLLGGGLSTYCPCSILGILRCRYQVNQPTVLILDMLVPILVAKANHSTPTV